MSYTFAIHGEKPCITTLVENVRTKHKICVKNSLTNGLRCYFQQKSTRGVDVVWNAKDNSLRIVTFICSTNEDYQLAFMLAQQAAQIMNANICTDDKSYEVDEFAKVHDERWIEELEQQYIHDLLSQIQNHETTVKIPCLFRDFYLGPNTAQKVERAGNARQRLLEMIKDVIYFRDQNVFIANTIIMKHYNKSFCVWGPGISYLFPNCDLFGIISEHGAPNTIPRKMIFELIPEKIRFLDEHHILVDSLNEKEYNSVCQTITKRLRAG